MHRQDLEHLNVLAILHYVLAGLTALTAMLPMLYVALGFAMLAGGAPGEIALMVIAIGGGLAVLLLGSAVLVALCGYYLHKRKARTFCFVVAAINCTQMPLGTVLGIFTILVLSRDSVQELFAAGGRCRDPEDDDHPPDRDHFDRIEDHRDDQRREETGYYGRDDHDH